MYSIVKRLTENRQIELAKSILEAAGYEVSKKIREDRRGSIYYSTLDGLLTDAAWDNSYGTYRIALTIDQEEEAEYLLSQGYKEGESGYAKYPYSDQKRYRVFYRNRATSDRELDLTVDGYEVRKLETSNSGPIDFDEYAKALEEAGYSLQKIGFNYSDDGGSYYAEMTADGRVVDSTEGLSKRFSRKGKEVTIEYNSEGKILGRVVE